jgi:ABC-type oligopeptide transport system substrate-binding subunit
LRKPLLAVLISAAALAGCQDKVHRPTCPSGKVCLEYGNNSEPLTLDPQKSNLVDEFTIIGDLIVGRRPTRRTGARLPPWRRPGKPARTA